MKRKKLKRERFSRSKFILFLGLVFLSGVLSFKAIESFNDFQKGMKIFQEKFKEKEELERKIATLQKTLSHINSPEDLALFLKQKFGLVGEGENLVYVVWPKEDEEQAKKDKNFFEALLAFFQKGFNNFFKK